MYIKLILMFLVVINVAACTTPPAYIDRSVGDQFVEGKTTYKEVVSKLGKPLTELDSLNPAVEQLIICYANSETTINPAVAIPIVGLFFTGAKSELRQLCFTF